jgi:hypothetical protein
MTAITTRVEISRATQREIDDLVELSPRMMASSINRTTRGLRAEAVRQSAAVYNLKQSTLRRYMFLKGATSNNLTGAVTLRVRAIPIEDFSPRIEMREVSLTSRAGHSYTRKLPFVLLARLRGQAPEVVPDAFPLHQRTSGPLRRGEMIRRRIGKDRRRLTRIRYYNFPKEWLDKLIPILREYGGKRLFLEVDAAFRTALGRLKRNG